MSKFLTDSTIYPAIADAIRAKNGESTRYKPGEMAQAIRDIEGGGYPEPTGTVQITTNGTHNVKDYSSAAVSVQPNLQSKTATQNGTVTPDSGYDGLSSVVVNVSGGGGDDPFAGLNNYILSNGNQYINTGYIPSDNARFECVAEVSTGGGAYATLFGVRDSGGDSPENKSCLVFAKYNSNVMYVNWGSNAIAITNSNSFYGTKTLCKLTKGTYLFKDVSGTIIANIFASSSSASSQNSIYLFGLNQGGTDYGSACRAVAKLYIFRIYEGSTLVMELLPAVDGNNVVCLQDTVSGNYFYNSGTGAFTYGTDS